MKMTQKPLLSPEATSVKRIGADWMLRYINEGIGRFSPSSVRAYAAIWRGFTEHLAKANLSALTVSSAGIEDYLLGIAHQETRRRYGRLLNRVYEHAVDQGWRNSNPLEALESLLNTAVERTPPTALPLVDLDQILAQLPEAQCSKANRDQAMVALLLGAGLRLEELRELRMSQLAETSAGLEVRLAGGTVRPRTLLLDHEVARRVRSWRTERFNRGVSGALVFPDKLGKPLAPNTAYRRIALVLSGLKEIQLPERLSAGVLRTTFARCILARQTCVTAQHLLGHRLLGSTLRMATPSQRQD